MEITRPITQSPDHPITQLLNSPLGFQSFAPHSAGVYQEIRTGDDVQPYRADTLPDGIGELVMMPEQMQAGTDRGQSLVDDRLAGVDPPARREERPGCFVRQEDVDRLQGLARDH